MIYSNEIPVSTCVFLVDNCDEFIVHSYSSPLVDKGCATTDEITATVIYHGISMEKRLDLSTLFGNVHVSTVS